MGDNKTYGTKNEGIAASRLNSGMFTSFIEMQDVMGAFVGHDHDNDYLGINKGILLAFGRVTGKDAYGDLKRGARIIELYEGQRKFNTWITTPDGREATYYYPSGLNSEEEARMTYSPALNVKPTRQGVAYTYYEGDCEKTADIAACRKVKEGTMKNFSTSPTSSARCCASRRRVYIASTRIRTTVRCSTSTDRRWWITTAGTVPDARKERLPWTKASTKYACSTSKTTWGRHWK